MRFSILLISSALVPMLMIFHGWVYTEQQMPVLRAQVLQVLRNQGVRDAVVELRYLDLHVRGDAPDVAAIHAAHEGLRELGLLRLRQDDLSIPARLRARLEASTLTLEGWLPEAQNVLEMNQLLRLLRPDLTLKTEAVQSDERVRWPEGEMGPLTSESTLLRPIVEKLKVAPELEIRREDERVIVQGMVPINGLRMELIAALKEVCGEVTMEMGNFRESTHTLPAPFAEGEGLVLFVRQFFSVDTRRRFMMQAEGSPVLEADATVADESVWLSLLRPVTGGQRVEMKLTFYPSSLHFPSYEPISPIAPGVLAQLREILAGQWISFDTGSTRLNAEAQARLAGLTPMLLTAGPALRLVIGGHPDPAGKSGTEQALAKARAEQVLSYLIEQGVPTTDISAVAFDPVPAGTTGAPAQIQTVEIMIR